MKLCTVLFILAMVTELLHNLHVVGVALKPINIIILYLRYPLPPLVMLLGWYH